MTTPNINQFSQTTVAGQVDLEFPGSVVTARVSPNQATALVAGQAVKLDTSTANSGIPNLLATTSNGDTPWGITLRNLKDASFPTLSALEIGRDNTVVHLTASGAITRGALVEIDYAAFTISQSAGINPVIGEAYDASTASGHLIRVWLKLPKGNTDSAVKVLSVVATQAQINAGLVLLPGVAGKAITVLNYTARVLGTFTAGTSFELESTNASPVAVTTIAEAGLTTGAVLLPGSANTTLGAGFSAPLGSGDGLKAINNGTADTGGTSITLTITYQQQ